MKSSYNTLMRSKFFNPAFNSAIFDGPLRIYFAQPQESLAMNIYFMVQQQLNKEYLVAKERSKASGANILVMFYPDVNSFNLSFDVGPRMGPFEIAKWNEDIVIGLRGPLEEDQVDVFLNGLREVMVNWRPAVRLQAVVSV